MKNLRSSLYRTAFNKELFKVYNINRRWYQTIFPKRFNNWLCKGHSAFNRTSELRNYLVVE